MSRFLFAIGVISVFASIGQCQEKKSPITGTIVPELAILDDVMLKFIAENQVPGVAIAMAKDGRLVYARGFGHRDPQLGLAVEPETRFRIASISKPITAVMILRLLEMGLLKLEDNPLDFLKLELPPSADPRLKKITIKQLLQHTAGFDSKNPFDPMFRSVHIAKVQQTEPPAKAIDIIRFMMTQPLGFEPGERYEYSNFGYCLLGRVIEKATNMEYEAAVKNHVLEPLDITNTQLGRTLTTAKNESRYFDQKNRKLPAVVGPDFGKPVPLQYGAWYIEAMDSHGGWIASAPDIVRLAAAFDEPAKCKVLKAETIQVMFARPAGLAGHDKDGKPRDIYYGCGWQVSRKADSEKYVAWHAGALDGTSTEVVRRPDGITWALLLNTRKNAKGTELNEIVIPMIHEAVGKIKRWPERDLFKK